MDYIILYISIDICSQKYLVQYNEKESELSLQNQEEIENFNYQNIFLPFR